MKLKFLALSLVMIAGVNMVNVTHRAQQKISYRKTENTTYACQ